MKEYYVVVSEWCVDYEAGQRVVGVYTSREDAVLAFKKTVDSEDRRIARHRGYTIYEDTDTCFDAGVEGEYVCDHVHDWIECVAQCSTDYSEFDNRDLDFIKKNEI